MRDKETLARIKSLVIPPAWTDVWICQNPKGHLQATGRDARGRKQSRYHPRWREVRDETKYERMMIFGATLPTIRERVEHDLSRPGLARQKILATIVRLMETTLIRIGNSEYARENHSYGLTTMRNKLSKRRDPASPLSSKARVECGVAARLGNTPATCRKCYVHPAVLDSYLSGAMIKTVRQQVETEHADAPNALRQEEVGLLRFLQLRLAVAAD